MSEQIRGEGEPKSESLEEQKFKAFEAAEEEVRRIRTEIEQVFEVTEDRAEAEKFVLEKLVPQIDQAIKRVGQSFDEWKNSMPARTKSMLFKRQKR